MAAESLLQVIELFPGPALVVGPGGEVVGASERAARWIGLDRQALPGRSLAGLVADPPARVAAFLDDCRRGGGKVAGTLTWARGGGAGGPCRVEGIAVRNGSGGVEAEAVVVHVLDDRGAALEDLREQIRARDAMLDRVAHDLRNPAAAISSALHLVRRASAPEDLAWAGDAMERQVRTLIRQLDDLLDLARLSRERVELQKERLDAAAAARAAASAFRPTLDDRDLRLTVSTSPGELAIVADPARLEQMLAGLLGQVAGTAATGGGLRLSVSREGDAIVFRALALGDEPEPAVIPPETGPTDVNAEEPGVRMMLVRKLAELHGGSASFRSGRPGEGSEIHVRLPAANAASGTATGPADGTPPGRARRPGPRRQRQRQRRPRHRPTARDRRPRRPRRLRRPRGPRGRPRTPAPVHPAGYLPAQHGRLRGRPPAPRRPGLPRGHHRRRLRLQQRRRPVPP